MSPYLSRAFSVLEMQNINVKFFSCKISSPIELAHFKTLFHVANILQTVVQKVVALYPVDKAIDFPNNNTYPLETDLSGG